MFENDLVVLSWVSSFASSHGSSDEVVIMIMVSRTVDEASRAFLFSNQHGDAKCSSMVV